MNLPSLCIPRVFPNITEARIQKIFGDLKLGEIERIDIVSKTAENGDKYNRVFVHFKRWFDNAHTDEVRGRLLNGKDIKIIYDEPWFWKVSAYRPPAPRAQRPQANRQQRPRATIELDYEKEPENFHELVARSGEQYTPLQRHFADEEWSSPYSRPPIQRGFTRMESGSEAWMDRPPEQNPVRPRKFTQNRPKTSNFAKPTAQRPTSNVTKAIVAEKIDLEEGEVKN